MRPGLHNAQFLPSSVSSCHGNWTVGAHGQRENQFCETDEFVHDRPRIRVNQARLYTETTPVVHQVDHLASTLNLPASGQDSGKGLKMVDFGNLVSWCEPRAVPCKQPPHKNYPTPQTEQRTWMALAGSVSTSHTMPRTLARTV